MRYFDKIFEKQIWIVCSVNKASDASSVESSSLFFTCRLRVVTYQTLYLHTCKQLLHFLHAPRNSLRMTPVSNENNINRPSSAQSRAIIISTQSRRWKEAWRESRALWVGIMLIKKMSTSLDEHTEGVAMGVWAIKRCYRQCWIWLSNMYAVVLEISWNG